MSLTKDQLKWAYGQLLTIRRSEEALMQAVAQGKHAYVGHPVAGQEASAVGVCLNLRPDDHLFGSHRAKAWALAKGCDLKEVMAEMYHKVTGISQGRAGEMQMADKTVGYMGGNPVVGSNIPLAVGSALAAKLSRSDRIAVSMFGDGASRQGVFHESLNLAAIWKVPCLFLCENNLYAESTPVEYHSANPEIYRHAGPYGIPGARVDGQDLFAVAEKAREAVEHVRSGKGPYFLETVTYRYFGHFYGDRTSRYRTPEEEERWKQRDPISLFTTRVKNEKLLTPQELQEIEARVDQAVAEAVKFAEESPDPDPATMLEDLYTKFP